MEKDGHLAAPLFKIQDFSEGELCLTFENLLAKTDFVHAGQKSPFQRSKAPMGGRWTSSLPGMTTSSISSSAVPSPPEKNWKRSKSPKISPGNRILFTTRAGLSNSIVQDLEYIVYVNPRAYDLLPTFEEKMEIAGVVNLLNKLPGGKAFCPDGAGPVGEQ